MPEASQGDRGPLSAPQDPVQRPRPRLNPALVRRLNVARVFHALRLAGESSQSDLVEATGLDPATVSAVVRQLRHDGWLRATKAPRAGRSGRPPTHLSIDRDAGLLVGARLEPDVVRLLATSLAGEPIASWQGPVGEGPAAAIASLRDGVEEVLADVGVGWDGVRAIGVGVPALMAHDGRLAFAPNLGWRDVPLRARLAEHWSVPVAVDNDTKAAALAEKLFGAARDAHDFVLIAGHSGVGGALYLGGRLQRGAGGYAGEVGHVTVVPGGRACGCGDRGCLEAYLSEKALVAQLRERGLTVDGYAGVAAAAADGDPRALTLLDEVGALLAGVAADVVDLLDPEMLVLAGSMTYVVPYLLPAIDRALREPALAGVRGACAVVTSRFGPEAVTMGGVALAMEAVLGLPAWWADEGGGRPAWGGVASGW
jgi:predicted NBD/HSP70 family sugar kinase